MKRLIIISSPDGAIEDERLSELADFLGVPTEIQRLEHDGRSVGELLSRIPPDPCCLAMHLGTLNRVYHDLSPGTTLRQLLDDRFSNILVYGVPAHAGPNDALKSLSNGAIQAFTAQPIRTIEYYLPPSASELCAQLAGQSLVTSQEHRVTTFEVQSDSGCVQTIMSANEQPMFVRLKARAGDLYLLASGMPDLRKPLTPGAGLGDESIPLLPPLIFLRHCFAETCWHSTEAPTARLIIDDPTLSTKYGALDFATLKASMRRLGYGTSIAYIPWNHWRSSRRSAAGLLSDGSALSICIHGCDHTNHEFQLEPAPVLARKAALGMQRMERLQNRVGVPFEDVMVFPQGRFCKAAISALRSTNYLAAVNTTCFPTDYAPNDLTIADFLTPAVTRFDGFPIFQRRYPRSLFELSLDLFLGKLLLIVEHHEYFLDGCERIEEFIAKLQRIEPKLTWPGLPEQMMKSNMRRRRHDGSTEVLFVTRRFRFTPREAEGGLHRLVKFEPDPALIERVLVDGTSVPFGFEKGYLAFEVQGVSGQVRTIQVVDRTLSTTPVRSFGPAYNAGVLLRRGLSEFRDGTLSRHKRLMKVAIRAARAFKATGNS
jgi:hypothetical protein